jgi:hypothetical protein
VESFFKICVITERKVVFQSSLEKDLTKKDFSDTCIDR